MSTTDTAAQATSPKAGRRAFPALLISIGVAVVINLVVLAVLAISGADLGVTVPNGPGEITIDAFAVIAITVVPMLLAGTVALLLARRWPVMRRVAAWTGSAVALLSVVAPLTIEADGATRAGLAVMHVVVAVAWFVGLSARPRERSISAN